MTSCMSSPPVCLVEDDEAMRDSLGLLLQLEGYEVREFSSATAFLESRISCEIGVLGYLILDLQLPGLSGLDVLRDHRERLKNWMVLMISGHAGDAEKAQARELGVHSFLDKPFAGEELLDEMKIISRTSLPN